jgi:hypothetical protein
MNEDAEYNSTIMEEDKELDESISLIPSDKITLTPLIALLNLESNSISKKTLMDRLPFNKQDILNIEKLQTRNPHIQKNKISDKFDRRD